jgi:hypothetical protein
MNRVQSDPLYRALAVLRQDALERSLIELAIVYGWSMVRLSNEIIAKQITEYKAECPGGSKVW